MKTSIQWWDEVRSNYTLYLSWLKRQYRGEVTAARRIRMLIEKFDPAPHISRTLETIAKQEETHAKMIEILLSREDIDARQIPIDDAENRYWAEALTGIDSFLQGTAIAAHAEQMRLERIRVIASDSLDFMRQKFFQVILHDEEWHVKAFRNLTDDEHMEATREQHELGKKALGLEA